jgi:hypothetical protein
VEGAVLHDIHLVRKTQHLSNLFDPRPRADRHLLDGNAKKNISDCGQTGFGHHSFEHLNLFRVS